MVVGEYLHLVSIALVPSHIFAVVAFIVVGALCDRLFNSTSLSCGKTGGFFASLNHTRFDVSCGPFRVRFHDQHHVVPDCNYGQYRYNA